ncbi:hypothetical protein KQH82_07870 [bacterium]|nr:hypothetical protein [bacterium]
MKTVALFAGVLLLCFFGGMLVSATAPQQATAEFDPCVECYMIACFGPGVCPPKFVPYNKVYGYITEPDPCTWPFPVCRWEFIGCGYPC